MFNAYFEKIKLPQLIELGINGNLYEDLSNIKYGTKQSWIALGIFQELFRNSSNQIGSEFVKIIFSRILSFKASILHEMPDTSISEEYGRTTVIDKKIAMKKQKLASIQHLELLSDDITEFEPNTLYIRTKMPFENNGDYCVLEFSFEEINGSFSYSLSNDASIFPYPITVDFINANKSEIINAIIARQKDIFSNLIKETETPESLLQELNMQKYLRETAGMKSDIPVPLSLDKDEQSGRYYSVFEVPNGYYNYISDISNEERFIRAIEKCAHDLGYLLKKGYVFQMHILIM